MSRIPRKLLNFVPTKRTHLKQYFLTSKDQETSFADVLHLFPLFSESAELIEAIFPHVGTGETLPRLADRMCTKRNNGWNVLIFSQLFSLVFLRWRMREQNKDALVVVDALWRSSMSSRSPQLCPMMQKCNLRQGGQTMFEVKTGYKSAGGCRIFQPRFRTGCGENWKGKWKIYWCSRNNIVHAWVFIADIAENIKKGLQHVYKVKWKTGENVFFVSEWRVLLSAQSYRGNAKLCAHVDLGTLEGLHDS